MLTPKHRALFRAAYATPLLRTAGEETEPPPADSIPEESPEARKGSQDPSVGPPAEDEGVASGETS